MINFRFHLISLIAVFLALAVGVVMGYAVLGQPTVDTLQGRVDTVEARSNEIRAENDRLRDEQARLESLLGTVDQFAATSRLAEASVLPVATRGVDGGRVEESVRLARTGGATVPGIVWLEPKWNLESDDDTEQLASIVGATNTTSRAVVRETAARQLASRLAFGPVTGRPDLLVELDDAGFVSLQGVDGVDFDATRVDGRANRMLVVGGNGADVRLERAVLPLATALAGSGKPVVVADEWREVEGGPGRGQELAAIRDNADLAAQIATVDNFDTADGPLVTVLVLGDVGRGTIGHYGFGAGADRDAPEWWGV